MDAWTRCLKGIEKQWNKTMDKAWGKKFRALSRQWNRQACREVLASRDRGA